MGSKFGLGIDVPVRTDEMGEHLIAAIDGLKILPVEGKGDRLIRRYRADCRRF